MGLEDIGFLFEKINIKGQHKIFQRYNPRLEAYTESGIALIQCKYISTGYY